jgi:hypothetical protein
MNKKLLPVAVGVGDALIVTIIGVVFLTNWWWIAGFAVFTGLVSGVVAARVI